MLKCRPGLKIELLTIIINVLETVETVQKKSSQINDNEKQTKKSITQCITQWCTDNSSQKVSKHQNTN